MKLESILSLLGFAQKAGKLISGQESVEKGIDAGKFFLIILAEDISQNTKTKIINICKRKKVPIVCLGNSDELGKAIGKGKRKIIGITDKGFAKEFCKRINLLTGVRDIDKNAGI